MPPTTLNNLITSFTTFLTVAIHQLTYLRNIYPQRAYLTSRAYNFPVHQCRHPRVCKWINDASAAVQAEILKGTVEGVVVVIFSEGSEVLERFVFGVGKLPFVFPAERLRGVSGEERHGEGEGEDGEGDEEEGNGEGRETVGKWLDENDVEDDTAHVGIEEEDDLHENDDEEEHFGEGRGPEERGSDDEEVDATTTGPSRTNRKKKTTRALHHYPKLSLPTIDYEEQLHGLLSKLSAAVSNLAPLPPHCTFTVAMELKEAAIPPIEHPQPWVPVQPSLQQTNGADAEAKSKGKKGDDLGGAKVRPVRSVEAGDMLFEVWIEEGKAKAKFKNGESTTSSAAS